MARTALLGLVLAVSGLAASTADAAFPGANGKIAFVRTSSIFTMDANGANAIDLTPLTAPDVAPAWSPDGSRIAFQSTRDGNSEIYVMDADGSGQTRLTINSVPDLNPAWSPDGEKIVFERGPFPEEIIVMNAVDGSGETNLTNHPGSDRQPAWSPDGTQIAFGSGRHHPSNFLNLYVMPAAGSPTPARRVNDAEDEEMPNWSPDGERIVFRRFVDESSPAQDHRDIVVMDTDPFGDGAVNITNDLADDIFPAWSPDGAKIVFTSGSGGNSNEIIVADNDGGPRTNITNNAVSDTDPDWQPLPLLVAITSGPSGTSNPTTATFEFAAVDDPPPPGRFECRLDGSGDDGFTPCDSPITLTGLRDGEHLFEVRYKPDGEPAGAVSERRWTVDGTAPEVTIDFAPAGIDNPPDATIAFHADEIDATFECTLDGATPFDCVSPHVVNALAPGIHSFEVTATDAAGNVSSPARAAWEVAAPPPAPTTFACPPGTDARAAFGVIVAVARSAAGCFVREVLDGRLVQVARGAVSVNGILLGPAPGTLIVVDAAQRGGMVQATGPVTLSPGDLPLGWTLEDGFTFDSLAQGGLAVVNRALALQEGVLQLAEMPVSGALAFELSADNGGQSKVTARITLPQASFQSLPGLSPAGTGLTVEVPITASNDRGLTGGVRLKLAEARLFGRVKLKDLDLFYDHTTRTFEGSAGVKLVDNAPAGRAEPTFTVAVAIGPDGLIGPLKKLSFLASNLNRHIGYGVFVQRFGASIQRAGDLARFEGTGGVSLGPRIAIGSFEVEALSLDGTQTIDIAIGPQAPEPFTYTVGGALKVVDIPFASGRVSYVPPARLEIAGTVDQTLFGYGIVGELASDASGRGLSWVSPEGFNLEVRGRAAFPGLGGTDPADAVFSTTGWAACIGPAGDRVGFGRRWGGELQPFSDSCELGPFRAVGRPAQASGATTVAIPRGARLALLSADGDGTPPKVLVQGPRGERVETPAGPDGIRDQRALLVQDPETDTTHVVLRRPSPGRWTVAPLPGSVRVTRVRVADALPPLRLSARVTGKDRRRTLAWRAGPLPGQRLTFTERGPQTANVLLTTARRRGRIAFRPDPAPGRVRSIDVTVTRRGIPRTTRTVGRFNAPPPPRLRRATRVRLRGRTLTWRRQAAAAEYALAITTPDGATTSHTTTRARLRLPSRPPAGRLTVRLVALDRQGRTGPLRTIRLRVRARRG